MKSLISHQEINGQEGQLNSWNDINWRKTIKIVKNLRRRIFRAKKLGQYKQLRRLQKLILKSYSNLLLSVRQITQLNSGKATSGIDKEVIKTPEDRVKLINNWKENKVKPVKRVYIPKSNGKKRCDPASAKDASGQIPRRRQTQAVGPRAADRRKGTPTKRGNADQERERAPRQRPLGIPTVRDRVQQAIVKNSLEPEWEAVFEPNSYGFRPKRSCHDAIMQCYSRLNAGNADRWVLDVDLKGFFDNINHETIINLIDSFPARKLIKDWLQAGFIDNGVKYETLKGTPQGGVISPILANIGLHGLEELITSIKLPAKARGYHRPKLGLIRYADDFVITAREKEHLETAFTTLKTWLYEKGLKINSEKTKIVHIDEGFNFLGFNLRHYGGKLLIKPEKEKVLEFCKKLKDEINKGLGLTQVALIKKLNPILRGFANYYRSQVSKEVFSYVNHRLTNYLWKWAVRRHPLKGKKWIKDRYFHYYNGVKWTFMCEEVGRNGKTKPIILVDISKDIPIIRHIKVKSVASADDANYTDYFEERNKSMGSKRWAKGSKLDKVAKNQNYKCPICNDSLLNGEHLEIHHIVPVVKGGSDDVNNLIHLHRMCHKQVHKSE